MKGVDGQRDTSSLSVQCKMFHIKKTCQKILGKDNCSTDENSQIYKA
jgi:hypothetical protein